MMFAALIIPGRSRLLFILPVDLFAVGLLIGLGPRVLKGIDVKLVPIHMLLNSTRNRIVVSFFMASLFILCPLTIKLVHNGKVPVVGQDALQYLGEALKFANGRSLETITDYRGSDDGTLLGTTHGFVYQAYLSHSLINTGNNPLGYPYDLAARVAFQVTFVYMLLSLMALAGTSCQAGAGTFSIILLLQVPQLFYISEASSRDGFRIIPLLLLIAVLSGLSPLRLKSNLQIKQLFAPMLISALALMSHTLDGFVVLCIWLAWLAWAILGGVKWRYIFLVSGAIGLGLAASSGGYIRSYLETGKIWTENDYLINAYQGSPLLDEYLKRDQARMEGTTSLGSKISLLIKRDQSRLSLPGMTCAVLIIAFWLFLKKHKPSEYELFLGLTTVTVALPFLGVFDVSSYRLSDWFIKNFRYPLHWYPMAAVCLAILFIKIFHRLPTFENKTARWIGVAGMAVLIGIVSFSSIQTVLSPRWEMAFWDDPWLHERFGPLTTAVTHLSTGERLWVDDLTNNYYINNHALIANARPNWEIVKAQNVADLKAAFEKRNIRAIALRNDQIVGWWDKTPLVALISDPSSAQLIAKGSYYQAYLLTDPSYE